MTTILVIEDETPLLEEIVTLLRFEGYEVYSASSGEVGVQLARQHIPDLIISDIMMPGLDGYGVLLQLQDDPMTSKLPFIFLTAKSDRAHMRYGMELGADDYVTKPFARDELLAAIRARLEKQKTVAQEYERRMNELRESLVLALPHELRTPLTSLVGYAELLKMDSAILSPDQVVQMAESIRQSGQRLQRQIENFLLYAQLELQRQEASDNVVCGTQALTASGDVVADAAYCRAGVRGRAHDLNVRAENVPVLVTAQCLRKIVEEVVDNACKFSPVDTPIDVLSGPAEAGDAFIVQVTDRGRGMTAEQIRKVGAYVQFERRLYEQQGTGLGLTIAKQLAIMLGGSLSIESEPRQWTKVVVSLPVAAEAG